MHKKALGSYEMSQMEKSLVAEPQIIYLSDILGLETPIFGLRPNTSITGTHKGYSYARMILEGIKSGEIHESTLITEFTSGRAGEAAAKIARLIGLRANIIMPHGITPEREKSISRISDLTLTPESEWLLGSMKHAKEASNEEPNRFLPNQSANPNNPLGIYQAIHHAVRKINPSVAIVTSGTGGTSIAFAKTGVPTIAIDPVESPSTQFLHQGNYDQFSHQPHKYWGSGAGAASPLLVDEVHRLHEVQTAEWQEALDIARWLNQRGLNVGLSTGANIRIAVNHALKNPEQTIITILHDTSEAYQSMGI